MEEQNPLRRARLARGLTLEAVIAATRLSPHIAAKIDSGRFGELPAGLYARAYIRAVATVVGLNPEVVLSEVAGQLPDAPDPLPTLREVVEQQRQPWPASVLRCAAAAIDGAAIAVIVSASVLIIEFFTGVRFSPATPLGFAALIVVTAIVTVPYFVIFAGIGGRTPGQQAAGVHMQGASGPMRLDAIGRRAIAALVPERTIWRRGGERLA